MGFFKNFKNLFVCVAVLPAVAFGATSVGRGTGARPHAVNSDSVSSASIRRAATSVIARNAAQNGRKSRTVSARPNLSRAVSNRSALTRTPAIANVTASRVATSKNAAIGRAAKSNSAARSATKNGATLSRAGISRATAVFNDVSKIGGGYADCRDSYATCMDQFCANANDTYRRCYCSDRFVGFRDTTESLDQALTMLAEFQNNNLDAVGKTAAEVNAMYSASEGEAAIKKDTSASQKLLNSISEVLAGKKTYKSSGSSYSSGTVGVLDISGMFSFSDSDADPFSGGMSSVFDSGNAGMFGSSGYTNMSDLEGADLYNAAHRQCYALSKNACGSDAVFNLARSAYSVMITQDCNLFEKNISAKKQSVQDTLRTAERYLREARLEEYRAHNSKDVNDCLNRVETALRQPTACGPNYEKCMDPTGMYVNQTTGEAIYSKALFDLNNLIVLDGSSDVLGANPDFNDWLEGKKIYAETALDSCRGIADTVWTEFKRSALIQISQAQDVKIQGVKDSCVTTIKECYDQQTGELEALGDKETGKRTLALSAVAARDMCVDKVLACSALYGDTDGCHFDDKSKQITQVEGKKCGLDSLLAFVSATDSIRIAKGCEKGLRDYIDELCGDDDDDKTTEWPWKCRNITRWDIRCNYLPKKAKELCGVELYTVPKGQTDGTCIKVSKDTPDMENVANIVSSIHKELFNKMYTLLADKCETYGGFWFNPGDGNNNIYSGLADPKKSGKIKAFYADVYNNKENNEWGYCVENTKQLRCLAQNADNKDYTTYDEKTDTCSFKSAWYEAKCKSLGGYYKSSTCYVRRSDYDTRYKEKLKEETLPANPGPALD